MDKDQIEKLIMDIPDEVLSRIQFSFPWQYNPSTARDADGFPSTPTASAKTETLLTREKLQEECWRKFHQNPHINTSVRGIVGRLTGLGFMTTSDEPQIQEAIEEIELDPRNRLYNFWPKYVGRAQVEGELFLCLTAHNDGFVEVDFIDPVCLNKKGDDDTGIIFHPDKTCMPLFYLVSDEKGNEKEQIPSIFVAHYPELVNEARKHDDFNFSRQNRSRAKKFRQFRGYRRFIVSWDRGFVTRRAISYLRTTLEWLNYYENLKKYEIDHKKSAGAYLWTVSMENPKTFKLWLSLSDEDRRKTGILAPKTPGSTLVLPPGMSLEAKNPQLPNIKDQDTDILQMVASGLNEPNDVLTGTPRGPYAAVNASRGPMSDRTSDEIAYFERFLRHDFWGSIFFLKSVINGFPKTFSRRECYGFADQKPKYKDFKRKPEMLIDIDFPVSEVIDYEGRARAMLGVKHGPIAETLGVPNAYVAKRLGVSGYARARQLKATEDDKYPELDYNVDAESLQEQLEGEKPNAQLGTRVKAKPAAKKGTKDAVDNK